MSGYNNQVVRVPTGFFDLWDVYGYMPMENGHFLIKTIAFVILWKNL